MVDDDPRVFGHHGIYRPLQEIRARFKTAADVAVGNEADQFSAFIDDGNGTETFFGHEEQGVLNAAVFGDDRIILAFMHDIVDGEQQFFAKGTAGMEDTELFFRKVVLRKENDSQSIAEGQ